MKKHGILIGLLGIMAVLFCLPAMAAEVKVNVRVEGAEKTLYAGVVTCSGDDLISVYDVLAALDADPEGVDIRGLEYGYITAIEGERAGRTALGWDGFGIRLGGKYISYDEWKETYVFNGAKLVVYYADEFGAGLSVPRVDTSEIYDGKLVFYAETRDGDGTSVQPIEGATVRWYCDDAFAEYVTDEQGCVTVHTGYLTMGEHRVSVELMNEEGVPMLLRMDPDYTVQVSTGVGDSAAVLVAVVLMAVGALGLAVLLPMELCHRRRRMI